MKLAEAAKRLVLAVGALKGDLDGVSQLNTLLKEQEEREKRLRKSLETQYHQTQYWYHLWDAQGREFMNSMDMFITEINTLRKKAGVAGEKWEEIVRSQYKQRHVSPVPHPVPGIATDDKNIQCPPSAPSELKAEEPKA